MNKSTILVGHQCALKDKFSRPKGINDIEALNNASKKDEY